MKKIFSVFIFLLFLFFGCYVSLCTSADFMMHKNLKETVIVNNAELRTLDFGGIQCKEFLVDSNYTISNPQINISQYLEGIFAGFSAICSQFAFKNTLTSNMKNTNINFINNYAFAYRGFVRAP